MNRKQAKFIETRHESGATTNRSENELELGNLAFYEQSVIQISDLIESPSMSVVYVHRDLLVEDVD